jgi:hypothetical protein
VENVAETHKCVAGCTQHWLRTVFLSKGERVKMFNTILIGVPHLI